MDIAGKGWVAKKRGGGKKSGSCAYGKGKKNKVTATKGKKILTGKVTDKPGLSVNRISK